MVGHLGEFLIRFELWINLLSDGEVEHNEIHFLLLSFLLTIGDVCCKRKHREGDGYLVYKFKM